MPKDTPKKIILAVEVTLGNKMKIFNTEDGDLLIQPVEKSKGPLEDIIFASIRTSRDDSLVFVKALFGSITSGINPQSEVTPVKAFKLISARFDGTNEEVSHRDTTFMTDHDAWKRGFK